MQLEPAFWLVAKCFLSAFRRRKCKVQDLGEQKDNAISPIFVSIDIFPKDGRVSEILEIDVDRLVFCERYKQMLAQRHPRSRFPQTTVSCKSRYAVEDLAGTVKMGKTIIV